LNAGNVKGRVFNGHLSKSKKKVDNGNGIKIEIDYYNKAPLKNALLGWARAKAFMNIPPECLIEEQAHIHIEQKLNFRYIEIKDVRERGMTEFYITSVLNAKYSIDKEH
jgi:hypothetical protein